MRLSARIVILNLGGLCVATSALAQCASVFPRPGETQVTCEATAPESILHRAHERLASQTDESYSNGQFAWVPTRTKALRTNNCEGAAVLYSLVFDYAALRKIGADNHEVEVFVPADSSCSASGFLGLRSANGAIVEPKVTRDRAVERARSGSDEVRSSWSVSIASVYARNEKPTPFLVWKISFAAPESAVETCRQYVDVEVNAESGVVLSASSGEVCE